MDKWLAVSAVQKAARRGKNGFAQNQADALIEGGELSYLQYRMAVSLWEDFGWGNPVLMETMPAWLLAKRSSTKEEQIMATKAFLMTMCSSAKDRTACQLQSMAKLTFVPDRCHLELMGPPQLIAYLTNKNHDIVARAVAAWLLIGTDRFHGGLMEKGKFSGTVGQLLFAYAECGYPKEVIDATHIGCTWQREPHAIMIGLAWELTQDTDGVIEPDDLVKLPSIGNVLSASLDKHTMLGKKAISYFVKACPDVKKAFDLADTPHVNHNPAEVVGTTLFFLEGQQCDMRLQYNGSKELLERWGQGLIGWYYSEDLTKQTQLCDAILGNVDILQHARERIMGVR